MTMHGSLCTSDPVFDALLFDMDGTLIDSRAAVERTWRRWTRRHGLDFDVVAKAAQGRRTCDTVALFCPPGIDPLTESAELEGDELADTEGIVAIPGARELLRALPARRWAIVTSAGQLLAHHRLRVAGLPIPDVLITAGRVARGKPSPEGFLLAAQQLNVDPARCLVFEDAPAGIAAARAARASVIAITDARPAAAGPVDAPSIPNFSRIRTAATHDGIRIAGLRIPFTHPSS